MVYICMASVFFTGQIGRSEAVQIQGPENDTVVLGNKLTVFGTAGGSVLTKVTLKMGRDDYSADVGADGKWRCDRVVIPRGVSVLHVFYGKASAQVLITRGEDIKALPVKQRVQFFWQQGTENELEKIARGTLNARLNKKELAAFIVGVKTHTVLAFVRAFAKADVEVVEGKVEGKRADVHLVEVLKKKGSAFGLTPYAYDCGNRVLDESSEIWLGSYRKSMLEDFESWEPMKKTDDWRLRMIDLGEVLGRTAAHEVGHAVGLVGSDPRAPCGWMLGCDGHNCSDSSKLHPLANRFNRGWFIMDPGTETLNQYRLGEPSRGGRASKRIPAVFNPFNRSYLRIIHPI